MSVPRWTQRPNWWHDASESLGPLLEQDESALAGYAVDSWPLGRKRLRAGAVPQLPSGVARPRSTEDVSRVVTWAGKADVPVVPWGGGSSVTGAAMGEAGALVIDLRGLDEILALDFETGHVHVHAGVNGGVLEDYLAKRGLTTWFSPQSLRRSTVGGWVATGATGQFSSRFGGIRDLVARLTVVLADGSVVELGTPPRGAVGPDLKNLFIGSEGAFGIVTEAVLRAFPRTPLSGLAAFAIPSLDAGIGALREMMRSDLRPILLRLYDHDEAAKLVRPLPAPPALLLTGFTGVDEVAAAEEHVSRSILERLGAEDLGPGATESWLESRYDFSHIERLLELPGGYAETIEVAGTWKQIPAIYRAMKDALVPLADEVLGHFSHTYADGTSLYLIIAGHASNDEQAVCLLESVWSVAMTTALDTGAVISHHHGVGRARITYLERQLGTAGASLLATLKRALDPGAIFHPGSLVPSAQCEQHLC